MPTFSERFGQKPIRLSIQKESIDESLRNDLWNIIYEVYLSNRNDSTTKILLKNVWLDYFHRRTDEFNVALGYTIIKNRFLTGQWYDVYDLIEIIPKSHYKILKNEGFTKSVTTILNNILEKNLSAYRFVDFNLIEITSEEEIIEIETAVNVNNDTLSTVKSHLSRALELFSDRKTPDYRNSIKESISAVESLCCIITNSPNATLGQTLKIIVETHGLHTALKGSFEKLYGYTSDAEGIRHALQDQPTLKQEDARFMLVACSAFINYLVVKANL
jgi:hypothetical protein